MYSEDSLIPISALQHYLYCPRQCALIYLEQIWTENVFTAEGRVLHEKADSGKVTVRGEHKTVTGLLVRSLRYGLSGKADVVEFHRQEGVWHPFPVEYKRGRLKKHEADRVQICAQALCLEEMLGMDIAEGALFYGQQRRRVAVVFDASLRALTLQTAEDVHRLFAQRKMPPAPADERCATCSLQGECLPRIKASAASSYLESLRSGP